MADYPLEELGGKTPLQAADKPNIDELAKRGRSGMLKTVPEGYQPGSDVANLSILGYDPDLYYPGGRGPIEAAAQGVKLNAGDLAFRANIITQDNGKIIDYSAGQITTEEAKELIKLANEKFGDRGIEFHPGISYRNLLILRNTKFEPEDFKCFAPHDHPGKEYKNLLVQGKGSAKQMAERLNEIMVDSINLFEKHSAKASDKARHPTGPRTNSSQLRTVVSGRESDPQTEDRRPSRMLWIWGPGKMRRKVPTIQEKYGWNGIVITGVDLIKGLGAMAGLKIVDVPGATAYFDTNFEGKADAALKALKTNDIAYVHIEAPDEAGHEGLVDEKVKAIENIDKRVIGRILSKLDASGEEYRLGFLCDHATPISLRTHTRDAIPFTIMGAPRDGVTKYDEESCKKGGYGLRKGPEFMDLLAGKDRKDE